MTSLPAGHLFVTSYCRYPPPRCEIARGEDAVPKGIEDPGRLKSIAENAKGAARGALNTKRTA